MATNAVVNGRPAGVFTDPGELLRLGELVSSARGLRGEPCLKRREALGKALMIVHDWSVGPAVRMVKERLDGNRDDALEFLDQALLRAYEGFKRFDEVTGTALRKWFLRIVERLVLDEARRREACGFGGRGRRGIFIDAATLDELFDAPEPSPELRAMLAERRDAVARAVCLLAPDVQPVARGWLLGLPFGKIAEGLGITVSAVRYRWERAKEALRKLLAEACAE